MGFKDVNLSNQALVSKQAWRLIYNPTSIAAPVLKGKFFPTSNFLRAENKDGSSYLWQSILLGCVGVRFRSITNEYVTLSSEKWKLRNLFNGGWCSVHFWVKMCWETVLQLKKRGWHRCSTCQMGSDAKVSDNVVKFKRE